jgi:hypothetical protein
VQFGTGLLLGQESNEGRVLGLLYGLSRLAIVFNNVLYMYKVLKDIYLVFFQKFWEGTAVPHAPTVDPPLQRINSRIRVYLHEGMQVVENASTLLAQCTRFRLLGRASEYSLQFPTTQSWYSDTKDRLMLGDS